MPTDDLLPEFREWLEKTSHFPMAVGPELGEIYCWQYLWEWRGLTDYSPWPHELPVELYDRLAKRCSYPTGYLTANDALLDLQQAWLKWRQTTTATT